MNALRNWLCDITAICEIAVPIRRDPKWSSDSGSEMGEIKKQKGQKTQGKKNKKKKKKPME